MPKGAHLKRPNPKINQVSFKVSDAELSKIKALEEHYQMSRPELFRMLLELQIDWSY